MKPWDNGNLRVDGRFFYNGNKPFFWLGDTAWRLFACLNFEESRRYLQNRLDKGYNVIQAVCIVSVKYKENDHLRLQNLDESMDTFISPENHVYWEHVEKVVALAEEMGLYIALLPTWGGFAKNKFLNEDNAEKYMKFLTDKFNKYKNIIWLLGGDIRGDEHYNLWDICGKTLRANTKDVLIGFHPFGRTSSSYWFHDCEWLDYNQFQSGHRRYDQRVLDKSKATWDDTLDKEPWHGEDSWRYVVSDLAKAPLKPTLDGEPSYEQIPQGLHDGTQPFWEEHHARRYAWWPVMAGAAGHTYGSNAIMQMYGAGASAAYSCADTWDVAMHHCGGNHMQFVRELMEEIEFEKCKPMQEVFPDGMGEKHDAILALGNDKAVAIYNYSGREFAVKLSGNYNAWWYDPSSGVRSYVGKYDLAGGQTFVPPVRKYGWNDWILVLKK